MAITYENVVFDRIIESLYTILGNEFSIPIRYDEHKGNQSFLITPGEDELIEQASGMQVRSYNINISYEVKSGGEYTKNNMKQVSEITERLKRLLFNNVIYNVSGTNKFFNGIVESVLYGRDTEDQSILNSLTVFNCQTREVV